MSCYGKYTKEERLIVNKIEHVMRIMSHHRRRFIDGDIKRINLIHSLNGKYIEKLNR